MILLPVSQCVSLPFFATDTGFRYRLAVSTRRTLNWPVEYSADMPASFFSLKGHKVRKDSQSSSFQFHQLGGASTSTAFGVHENGGRLGTGREVS